MKQLLLALTLSLGATQAFAGEAITPSQAANYVGGGSVTVEGTVGEVFHDRRSGAIFVDMGGRYPNEAFTAVIWPDHADTFPKVDALSGATVDVTGEVQMYRGRPEIILERGGQLQRR